MLKNKNQILNSFFDTIAGIADKEYQEKIWIRGEGPEVDDFDETLCHFSDMGDSIINNYQEYGLTQSQSQILKNFRNELKKFARKYYHPLEFIDTPEWTRITEMAKEVLRAFHYQKDPGK